MMTKNKTAAKKTEDQSVVYKVPAAFALMIVVVYAFWKLGGYYSTVEGFTALYPLFCTLRYVFLALSIALSGALLSQYQGFADVGMGRGAIVIGLAAVIIGEALFSRIFHNFALKMAAVSLGAIIYYIVIQLVLTLGFDANLLKLLSASVVAVFLAVPYWKSKYFAKPAAKKAQKEDAKNA